MYVRKYFHPDAKAAILEIVNATRREFEGILRTASWMDEKTRHSAIEKLNAMSAYIAYPDQLLDNSVIEEYYQNLSFDYDSHYFVLNLAISKYENDYKLSLLRTPALRSDWYGNYDQATIVNAFYSPHKNSISKKTTRYKQF